MLNSAKQLLTLRPCEPMFTARQPVQHPHPCLHHRYFVLLSCGGYKSELTWVSCASITDYRRVRVVFGWLRKSWTSVT